MFGLAVQTSHDAILDLESELRRDQDCIAPSVKRTSQKLLVGVGPVHFGRVEESHAQFDGPMNRGDGFALVTLFRRAIRKAHPHAAESNGRNFQLVSKFARLHLFYPSRLSN